MHLVETGYFADTSFLLDLILPSGFLAFPNVPTDVLGLGTGTGFGEPDPPPPPGVAASLRPPTLKWWGRVALVCPSCWGGCQVGRPALKVLLFSSSEGSKILTLFPLLGLGGGGVTWAASLSEFNVNGEGDVDVFDISSLPLETPESLSLLL